MLSSACRDDVAEPHVDLHRHASLTKQADEETALRVGQRNGKPVILTVEALRMHQEGFQFFLADKGVWLTDAVPAKSMSLY